MASTHIRDILTAFNPSLDFFAITTGDGRIKIWDTLKGQIQTEFADFTSTHQTNIFDKQGHLSVDYTCIKWLSFQTKRKRKHSSSLLVLGTGSGDVLALDVSAGQLSWKINDCHPGGVRAISSLANGSNFYTAGSDGMICMIDFTTGNLQKKFKASSKAISCISVSPDGKKVATASAQLKIFNCSNEKKIQKFSGHPGSVRCMVFTEDGKHILSSSAGERNIAVWKLDGAKKQSASCVLAMEHPAVFLDSRCIDNGEDDEAGICVLAISEIGLCYIWFGNSIDELRTAKPTKISLSLDAISTKNYKGALPAIYAAKLQSTQKPSSGQVFLVYGMLVKPSFQNVLVHSGTDVKLSVSRDGVLLPMSQSLVKSKKRKDVHRVNALDRANAEDALLPIPKVFDSHEKEEAFQNSLGKDVMDDLLTSGSADSMEIDDGIAQSETDVISMEDRMRSRGLLYNESDCASNFELCSKLLKGIDLEATLPKKKVRAAVLSMEPSEAFKLLEVLLAIWQSRSSSRECVLPWMYNILVIHGHDAAEESVTHMLDMVYKITNSRGATLQSLLQLSGRLQLVTSQIDKASQRISHSVDDLETDESEDEDEFYHEDKDNDEDDASEISTDDEN
ncbi:unnamed protein product [Trifolium pratense]|uniref:Uncharacterized protein n=1 Tax=Trifolium pratense TaxID=57577 RepID=A0ACB0IEX7_TRIPR|nr:unnamed protein product [Trifolium pratense]